jgi:hypothetical protein
MVKAFFLSIMFILCSFEAVDYFRAEEPRDPAHLPPKAALDDDLDFPDRCAC